MTTDGSPHTREDFLALPIGPDIRKEVGAYWADDTAIISLVDDDGNGWMLGQHLDGTWFRQLR